MASTTTTTTTTTSTAGPQHQPAGKIRPNLTGPQETLLGILSARATDARSPRPVLGDAHAGRILSRLDYDFARLRVGAHKAASLALRARYFDRWAAAFLRRGRGRGRRGAREPVTVLHLAAGLDTRALRLWEEQEEEEEEPSPRRGGGGDDGGDDGGDEGAREEVLWVDVDLPDVVDVRRRLEIPEPDPAGGWMRYELRAADVTEENWLGRLGLPRDRKTFVLFEGLTVYLEPEQGRALIETLTSYFVAPGNQMAFDCLGWWMLAMQRWEPIARNTSSTFRWAIDEPKEIEQFHEGLRLREVILPATDPGNADLPALYGWFIWITSWIPALRKSLQYALYEW